MDEVKTRRQLLEEAWTATEEKEDEGTEVQKVGAQGDNEQDKSGEHSEIQKPDEKREESAEENKGKDQDEVIQRELAAAKKIESGKGQQQQQPPPQLDQNDRAPGAWKPAARELWAQVPKEVREEVRRRELEIERTLTQTGTMRKFATDFAQMVAPYQHIIRAQNSTPLQAVDNLMRTAAALATGSPQQKAATIGQIISNYGIDLQVLDQYLSQNYDPKTATFNQQQNQGPPAWAQPIFNWMQSVQQNQQNYEQQQRVQADREIEEMENEPFFNDLRNDIADIMEIAANRGKVISLKDAYKKAIQLDPEISKIMKQREASKTENSVSQAAATLARAKKASKTLAGAPKQDGTSSSKPKTRREQLAEAWEDQISS